MKRTMPVKTKRIELEGEYEGWWYEIRTNSPVGPLTDAFCAFEAANKENLAEIRLSEVMPPIYKLLELTLHNWNFVDEKGKDLPANKDGIRKLPIDLLMPVAEKIQETILEVPLAHSTD